MKPSSFALPQLHRRFRTEALYQAADGSQEPLPFRFTRLDSARYVATNLCGEFAILDRGSIEALIDARMRPDHPRYAELVSKHFLYNSTSDVALDLIATKVRTKYAGLADFTGLHIFVVTLRCDHSCPYCQVSRVSSDRAAYDMSPATADRAIDLMFLSPNRHLKVEFQGGESLLNFELIRHIVTRIEGRNLVEERDIQFVVATNLSPLSDEMLEFFKDHRIYISTSLDGPRELHNANRPRPGNDSYERAVAGIQRCREALGKDSVSALMTTTRRSLEQPEAIIDEYRVQGFDSIFLRWLSPFGFAVKTARAIGYEPARWVAFYERGLRYILRLNREGVEHFREEFAGIVLRKMLTPYGSGYVDLASPAACGIGVVVYNYDGDAYVSDEARMLAEVGDRTFRLGNVHDDGFEDLFLSDSLADLLLNTMTDCTPCCSDCAFEPYCGTDPVFHHATQGDMVGHRPTSAFCERNMFVFRLLISMLEDDASVAAVLRDWTA